MATVRKNEILSSLVVMGYDEKYIARAVKIHSKSKFGTNYNLSLLVEIIDRLKQKDALKNNKKKRSGHDQGSAFCAHFGSADELLEYLNYADLIDYRFDNGRYVLCRIIEKDLFNEYKILLHPASLPLGMTKHNKYCYIYQEYMHLAIAKSITLRKVSRASHALYSIGVDAPIDINPLHKQGHQGWKHGQIIKLDDDSAQAKVSYYLKNKNHCYWIHLENAEEAAPFNTKYNPLKHDMMAAQNKAQADKKNEDLHNNLSSMMVGNDLMMDDIIDQLECGDDGNNDEAFTPMRIMTKEDMLELQAEWSDSEDPNHESDSDEQTRYADNTQTTDRHVAVVEQPSVTQSDVDVQLDKYRKEIKSLKAANDRLKVELQIEKDRDTIQSQEIQNDCDRMRGRRESGMVANLFYDDTKRRKRDPKKSVHHKLLQSLRYKVHTMPSPCLDSEDEYEEKNEWMVVCPTDKDTTRTNASPPLNNTTDSNGSDKDGNSHSNRNQSGDHGGSDSFESGFNGSDNRDDDGDDDDKESKSDTEDDHDEYQNEDEKTDQFIYFLMHEIETCDDVELRQVLSSFSNACIDKVLGGIQRAYNQKIRICKMRQSMRMKKQKKKKKQKSKSWSTMQRNMTPNIQQSLNPLQVKSQYQIYKTFTSDVVPSKVIGIPAIGSDLGVEEEGGIGHMSYDYLIKSLAINEDNCYVNRKNTMRIFNFGLHLEQSKQDAYFIAKRQHHDRKRYEWLVDEILTQTEIFAMYSNITLNELPIPNRIDTHYQIMQVGQEIMKLKDQSQRNIIDCTQWNKIRIYGERNNKRRMQLMYTNHEFKARCRQSILSTKMTLFPIVMFDQNDKVCTQYIMIVSMERNVDIAVSFKYDISEASPLTVVGIHLNKDLIFKQHQVLCESQTCHHLSCFKSSINYMHIGNCDDASNQKKGLQQELKNHKETIRNLQLKLSTRSPSTSCGSQYADSSSPFTPPRYSLSDGSNSQLSSPIDTGCGVEYSDY